MPPKRRTGGPSSPQNRRPKIAGSSRSLNVPAGTSDSDPAEPPVEQPDEVTPEAGSQEAVKPTLSKAESGEAEPPKTETDAPESTPGPDLTKPTKTVADEPKAASEESKAPAATTAPQADAGESPATSTQPKGSWRLVAILGAAAVIVAIVAGIAFFKVGAKTDDIAWVDEGATAEVLRVTPSALAAVFTFSPDTFDADFDKGVQGLNQSMRDQLTQYKDTQKAGVEQTQTATTADVPLIGITRLEKDRAQLLAQLNVSSTQNGVAADSRSGMVIVSLEKQDGNWLISEIRDQ
ncbi:MULTISPECIES: hypothetical protein [Rhodococcus]|uniref:hypothetical protein n=1 Tax=Rhodococcus TaxID=1827 RepID=UPI00067F12C5|nr:MULTISPECIES: hypothetical protein [Rhodococcus]MBT2265110.1 hypothetical protein [Rhodococcus erythropolis]MCT6734709.1 hypothetical protein [Rhodococcus qingshengii]MEA1798199.1 hypothetical protein [Rhodococcus qingshengii]